MDKHNILKLIDLKLQIAKLEESDTVKKEIMDSGSYAIAEGYKTTNMEIIEGLENEIDEIKI